MDEIGQKALTFDETEVRESSLAKKMVSFQLVSDSQYVAVKIAIKSGISVSNDSRHVSEQ